MKKILIAAFAALALFSCDKEDTMIKKATCAA